MRVTEGEKLLRSGTLAGKQITTKGKEDTKLEGETINMNEMKSMKNVETLDCILNV